MYQIPTMQTAQPTPPRSPGMILERAIVAARDAGAEISIRRGRVDVAGGKPPADALRVLRLRQRDIVDAVTNPRQRGPVRCWRCRYGQTCDGRCRYE